MCKFSVLGYHIAYPVHVPCIVLLDVHLDSLCCIPDSLKVSYFVVCRPETLVDDGHQVVHLSELGGLLLECLLLSGYVSSAGS